MYAPPTEAVRSPHMLDLVLGQRIKQHTPAVPSHKASAEHLSEL